MLIGASCPIEDDFTCPPLLLVLESAADDARVRCCGELDMATTAQLEDQVQHLVASGCSSVTLDLGSLTFFDCSGLRMLMRLKLEAELEGWGLTLLYGEGPVRRLIELTDTSTWFAEAA
jgi:anti-anti-sigma factor